MKLWQGKVHPAAATFLATAPKGHSPQVLAWFQPLDTRLVYKFLQRCLTQEAVQ
jgi:hypothetical protein